MQMHSLSSHSHNKIKAIYSRVVSVQGKMSEKKSLEFTMTFWYKFKIYTTDKKKPHFLDNLSI